jgi:cysteine desulfurase
MSAIYLDYAATTPVDPQVIAAMTNYLGQDGAFGNPHSSHILGQAAKIAIESARDQVASLIKATANEIIWTSGATEANNLAIKGAAMMYQGRGKHIITVSSEHHSVLSPCQYLAKNGFSLSYLPPKPDGLISCADFTECLREDTILVSIMLVNNELGTIQDLANIAAITSQRGIILHVDAAQAAGKLAIDVSAMPIDLLSLCAHKIYGPKGIGALYLRRKPRVNVVAQLHGGDQEQGLRAGTLATHQIVGMGVACALAQQLMATEVARIKQLRNYFLTCLINSGLDYVVHGHSGQTVPHIVNLRFGTRPASLLLNMLPQLAIAQGSACQHQGQSQVLRAIGLTSQEAAAALRISFGRFTTQQELAIVARQLQIAVSKLDQL